MYRIVLILLSSLILWSCSETLKESKAEVLPFYNSAEFTPSFINDAQVEAVITHQIADFSFVNQDGITINEKAIKGKVHVANFIFTTCGSICPSMTKNLKQVSDEFNLSDSLVILSYSVTPWVDSVPRLKTYTELHEINNPNWHFLTGSTKEIYQLARQSYFAEEEIGFNRDSTDFLHTEHFLLVDQTKRIRGIYNGTLQLEMQQLIKDIRTLNANFN